MNGQAAVRQALVDDSDLIALVPAAQISADGLPEGSALPAIGLEYISGVDLNIPNQGAERFVTERIQATVMARDSLERAAVIKAVRKAAAGASPEVDGISNVTIHTDGRGPNVTDKQASIFYGFQDFKVKFCEPT